MEEKILENISAVGFFNRGVKKRRDLKVMNTVKKIYGVSHALVEVCFIDNKNDIDKYMFFCSESCIIFNTFSVCFYLPCLD
mgnify:CR=1 FL=1